MVTPLPLGLTIPLAFTMKYDRLHQVARPSRPRWNRLLPLPATAQSCAPRPSRNGSAAPVAGHVLCGQGHANPSWGMHYRVNKMIYKHRAGLWESKQKNMTKNIFNYQAFGMSPSFRCIILTLGLEVEQRFKTMNQQSWNAVENNMFCCIWELMSTVDS